MRVEVKLLNDRLRQPDMLPGYATERAAAIDLRACSVTSLGGETVAFSGNAGMDGFEWFNVAPGQRIKIGSGVALHLDSLLGGEANEEDRHIAPAAMVIPRSGLGSRGIVLSNLVGLIDPDYQGEVVITLWNASGETFRVNAFDRLAQMFIVPAMRPMFDVVDEFSSSTERGAGGFGSTGVR